MKFAQRTSKSPGHETTQSESPIPVHESLCLREYHHVNNTSARIPPWLDIPPSHTFRAHHGESCGSLNP